MAEPESHIMSADNLSLMDAVLWMKGLAEWLDEQEEPLRFKNDDGIYLAPHDTARVLRLLTQPVQGVG